MAEKYFAAPTTAQEISSLYEKGKEYNNKLDLSNTVETNRNFYCGNQWEGLDTEGLKPVVLNFIRPTVQIKAASIMSEDIAMTVRPYGIPGATSEVMEKEAAILTDELNRLWEKRKGTTKTRRILTSCPVDGDGCWHMFWDPTAPVATVSQEMLDSLNSGTLDDIGSDKNGNTVSADAVGSIGAEGDLDFEQILNTRCFFGNTSDPDVQSQPWILIASREFTATLKKRAEGEKGVDIDDIKGGSDDYFDDEQEDRTTLFTLYYRDEDTDTIWSMESTADVLIKEATDTGLHCYPIAWLNWEERLNSYHGYSAVSELVQNQLAVNVLATMSVASVSRAAFPTIIYRKDLLPNGWDNGVGSAIGVNGFVENVNQVAHVVEGANYGYQVDKLMEYLISTTNTLNGATDATLGNVNPENTSAIIAAQKAATTPLELHRRNLYQFIEDWARIAIDFMATYYGVRPVAVFNQTTNEEEILEFDFSTINTAALDIKIDIGGSSYWSELTEVKTLDNLFLKEMISGIDYIDLMPENLMPHKQKALANLKAREVQTANPEQQMMDAAMGMNEEMPLQESGQEQPSNIAPTAEDLLGVTQMNRINATVAKAHN
ncbi:MAG: hypothetical protein U0M15_00755 [Bacillota bacterium]|nr:hypothetical protein [Bacillota bacterium]